MRSLLIKRLPHLIIQFKSTLNSVVVEAECIEMLARLILYSVLVKCILSANILFINPVISRSHNIFNTALAIGLAQKGHNITMLSSDAAKKPIKNVHVIVMEGKSK